MSPVAFDYVDFPAILARLGVDVFNGKGREVSDRNERFPPRPGEPENAKEGTAS